VLTCHPREFPHVADAYGAACAQKYESEPASQTFSFAVVHVQIIPQIAVAKNAENCVLPLTFETKNCII
jgi:hypothetical protein